MITCKDIQLKTMSGLQAIEATYKSKEKMFEAVNRQSGVSVSMITKMWYGERKNPSVDVMDKLASAVSILVERRLS